MPRKFKDGDKVRVRMDKVPESYVAICKAGIGRRRVGKVEEVLSLRTHTYPYGVRFAGGSSEHFAARELELVKRKGG